MLKSMQILNIQYRNISTYKSVTYKNFLTTKMSVYGVKTHTFATLLHACFRVTSLMHH